MKLNKPQKRAENDDKPGKQNQILTPLDIKKKAKGKKGEQGKKKRPKWNKKHLDRLMK